ncbi:hypothetical protein [Caloranaerobacter sp. DY30410]|uniref:hypothetical protein n=1 Tax=Caloranaerobacter sp. DY30410 TaxID=3238305 RepID=UPI003D001DA2
MEIINDLIYINKTALKKSYNLILKNWTLIFTGIVYSVLNLMLFILVGILFRGVLSIIAGFVLVLAISSFISDYLYLLYNVVVYGKFTLNDFKYGFKAFVWKIYGIFFIGWMASYILSLFIRSISSSFIPNMIISFIINLLIFIFLNPLPETIYLKDLSSWDSIQYSYHFIKENFIQWFVSNSVFILMIYFLTGKILGNVFMIHIKLKVSLTLGSILMYLIGQVVFTYMMIYRGVLFDILSTSTIRKRKFMRDLY